MTYCSCSTCGAGIGAKRPVQACLMMVFLAYPSKAFLPAPSAQLIRHTRTFSKSTLFPQTAARRPRNALRYAGLPKRNIHGAATQSQRALVSLSATDDAKEAAVAAVQEAEKALNRAVDDAGVAGNADNVQAAVTAARAAARNAMDSLRRQGSGFGDIGESTQDIPAWRQDETSPARNAVAAALSAISQAEIGDAPTAASTAAHEAVAMVKEALDRRESAGIDLGVEHDESPTTVADSSEGDLAIGQSAGGNGGDLYYEEELTKEPESARVTRNSPAASHCHMSHLLWRQVAGPGDTVLDCTAGNGHDSLELAKIVALNDGVGKLYVMDVQERALDATRGRLDSELGEMALKRSKFTKGNFRKLPTGLGLMSVQLIVYNLGWLPGGDKSITTKLEDTLESIEEAKRLVKSGGMISVMLYRGHPEGKREAEAVLQYASELTHVQWRVFVHERINRPGSPVLLTLYRL